MVLLSLSSQLKLPCCWGKGENWLELEWVVVVVVAAATVPKRRVGKQLFENMNSRMDTKLAASRSGCKVS